MKLLHFTDSHLSITPPPQGQFHVQPFWRGEMRVLFERLARVAAQADAIVFTGDATHGGGRREARFFFDLLSTAAAGKPVFMVLGNHDVVNPAWEENFAGQAEQYTNITMGDGVYPLGEIDLLLMHGGYLSADNAVTPGWDPKIFPVPGLSDDTIGAVDSALGSNSIRPVVAATHCPSHFLPPSAAGFAAYVGAGMEVYSTRMTAVLDKHPRVQCVLSGHIHFNSAKTFANGRVHQSLASFAEYPCQVRLVELTPGKLESRLISLAAHLECE